MNWLADIQAEVYRRALINQAPPVQARPPWESVTVREHAPFVQPAEMRNPRNGQVVGYAGQPPVPTAASYSPQELEDQRIEALVQERMAQRMMPRQPMLPMNPHQAQQAPQLLPGVRMTARTDPKMAMRFAGTPDRGDGIPAMQGSGGKTEGMIDLGPAGH